jgi:hypothetical protein
VAREPALRLIDERPGIALTVFDTSAVPNEGTGFYATATARRCPDEQLDHGLRVVNRRLLAQGLGAVGRDRVTGGARLRLYVAEVAQAWVLDQDADVDQRAPVRRADPRAGTVVRPI